MSKTNVYAALLIVAFAVAVMAALNWLNVTSTVSLCEIALNPNPYNDQTISIKANLYSYHSGIMHLNGIECGPRSDAWATLELDSLVSTNFTTQQFLESIKDVKQQGEYKMAEVRVTGRIEDLKRQSFAPRFILYATQIEQSSEISTGKIEDGVK